MRKTFNKIGEEMFSIYFFGKWWFLYEIYREQLETTNTYVSTG